MRPAYLFLCTGCSFNLSFITTILITGMSSFFKCSFHDISSFLIAQHFKCFDFLHNFLREYPCFTSIADGWEYIALEVSLLGFQAYVPSEKLFILPELCRSLFPIWSHFLLSSNFLQHLFWFCISYTDVDISCDADMHGVCLFGIYFHSIVFAAFHYFIDHGPKFLRLFGQNDCGIGIPQICEIYSIESDSRTILSCIIEETFTIKIE